MPNETKVDLLTVPQIAARLQCEVWRARRVIDRMFPNAPRAGLARLIDASALPSIRLQIEISKANRLSY